MKKIFKRISALILVMLLMMSLCGCTMKDMKSTQAFWGENGEVLWQGEKYLKFTETYGDFNPIYDYEKILYVTETDVPLLLQYYLGDCMNVSIDSNFLIGSEYIYCKDSELDRMNEKVKNGGEMTTYYYEYYTDDFETKYHKFYENQVNVIESILEEVEPKIMDYDDFDEKYYDYSYFTSVFKCSDDLLFSEYAFDYYNRDDDYILAISDEEEYLVYQIPSKYVGDIKVIFENVEEIVF